MEVSVQPSYTFPSRKVYANRALGLQALINLQQLTTVPKRPTDISLETSLFPSTTIPKTLDKDTIDWTAKLPVVPPQYVQPGQAEGLTHVAQSQQFEQQILRIVSANNALKRGNYKSAEAILGRQMTAEEITNRTITPNVRASETGEKIHVGNHINAIGARMKSGISKETADFEARFATEPFFNDLAAKLNLGLTEEQTLRMGIPYPARITPGEAARLKTAFGYVGDLDFSAYGMSQSRESRARAIQGIYDAIIHQMDHTPEARREAELLRRSMEGDASSAANRAAENRQTGAARQVVDAPGEVGPDPPLQDPEEEAEGAEEEEEEDEKKEEKEREEKVPPAPPMDEARRAFSFAPGRTQLFGPGGLAEQQAAARAAADFQRMLTSDVGGASRGPIEQLMARTNAPFVDPTVRSVFHPASGDNESKEDEVLDANVQDQAMVNVQLPTGTQPSTHIANNIDMLEEAKDQYVAVMRRGEAQSAALPKSDDLNINEAAMTVLDAPRGRRRPRELGDEPVEGQALSKVARNSESLEDYRGIKRRRQDTWNRLRRGQPPKRGRYDGGGIDVRMLGSHHGNRRSYSKAYDRRNPYVDDRFLPDADSYDPRGAVVSGDLMRRTGTDAMAISAQLQVPETHQWTELPVRKFRQFPEMTEETRTDPPIPIAQSTSRRSAGAGGTVGHVQFGKYLLDMNKLRGGVVALVHAGTRRKIRSFPNRTSTPGLSHALKQIVSGGAVHHKKMTHHDRLYVNRLVRLSGADVDLPSDVNMPPHEQLKVLMGEIEAGNDSPDLKQQLRSTVTTMKRMKQLSAEQANEIREHYL
jgi:hypothetical protein